MCAFPIISSKQKNLSYLTICHVEFSKVSQESVANSWKYTWRTPNLPVLKINDGNWCSIHISQVENELSSLRDICKVRLLKRHLRVLMHKVCELHIVPVSRSQNGDMVDELLCQYFYMTCSSFISGGHNDLYPNLPFIPGGINPSPGPGLPRPRFDPYGPLPDINQMPGPSRRGRRPGPSGSFPPGFLW